MFLAGGAFRQRGVVLSPERSAEKCLLIGGPHNILATSWRFLGPLSEIFMNIFRSRGFSTVSLGTCIITIVPDYTSLNLTSDLLQEISISQRIGQPTTVRKVLQLWMKNGILQMI
jgi:hypothetical protein